MQDGDRITGKLVSQTTRTFRVQTSYGRLLIPKSRVERWQRADGREEVLNPAERGDAPAAAWTQMQVPPARVVLMVQGTTFWHAWDRREAPADPSLRLEVRLNEEIIATYTDVTLDPKDLPGATVNTFSFLPAHAEVSVAEGVASHPAEVQPGRIVVKLDLPRGGATTRRLRLSYQRNEGSVESPAWRDLITGGTTVYLSTDTPALIEMRQTGGQMDFSGFPRRRMKKVETFGLEVGPR